MKNKAIIVLTLPLILAGALFASSWQGTYSGDDSGTIWGTLSEDTDPPIYNGEWASYADYEHNYGTWYGRAEEVVNNYYFVEEGDIIDDAGDLVGHWSGYFPVNDDALAYGRWWKFNGWRGTWSMYRP